MWKRRKLLGRDFARRWNRRERSTGDPPPRPRVLIEEHDVAEAFAYWRLLKDNGYQVSWCPGPSATPPRKCPLVAFGQCDLVQCADVVVSSLPLHRESSRKVIAALRHLHPETPMIVQAPKQMLTQWAPLFEGRSWGAMRMPVTSQTVLDSVELALARSVGEAHGDVNLLE
jgi:hypothetical protein